MEAARLRVASVVLEVMSHENQHWVPKFLIKSFSDTDGRVFCLNIKTDEVKKRPPKRAASGAGFYEFVINDETISFEDRLEKIETVAAPILKHTTSSRSVAGLTDPQRRGVANFMAAQSFRTQAFYWGLELGSSRQQFGPAFMQLWQSAFLLSAEILRRRWIVMVIDHDDVFYLGDHPVVLQDTENRSKEKELGFDIAGVEAFLPISPKCALYMPCFSTSEQIILGYENALSACRAKERGSGTTIENAEFLKLVQRVINNSGALYKAITQGSALIAARENVENLNYLQCFWASSALYSNRRDFSFAKKVFNENPQYRSPVRARLAPFGS